MFCPNCGNKIDEKDNYCSLCGKNLKSVKISIENLSASSIKKGNFDETRVFKPIAGIDSIDSSTQLKDIIKAVDKKISKNISDYEQQSRNFQDTIQPKKQHSSNIENLINEDASSKILDGKPINKDVKKNSSLKKESLKKNIEEVDLSLNNSTQLNLNKSKSEINDLPTKEKKSLKKLWKDFINEDDDEFSIFSSLKESKSLQKDSKKSLNMSSNDFTLNNMEDTMGVSKLLIEEELKKNNFEKSDNANTTSAEYAKIFGSIKENDKKDSKPVKKESKSNYNSKQKDFTNKPDSITYKSFTELVNENLKKSESPKEEDLKASIENKILENLKDNKVQKIENKKNEKISQKNKINPKKAFKEKRSLEKKSSLLSNTKENNPKSNNELELKKNSNYNLKLNNTEKFIQSNLFKIIGENKNKNLNLTLFVLASLMTIIPILISEKTISLTILVLFILKILLKVFQYYTALNVATDKSWIDTSNEEIKTFSLINFLVCETILLILFLISPWNGFFNFTLISALSPMPIATILLFIFSLLIASSLFHKRIEKKIDFVAWYLIIFGLIEALGKLIFIFINVLIS